MKSYEPEELMQKEKPLSIKFDGYEFVLWFKDDLIVTVGHTICYCLKMDSLTSEQRKVMKTQNKVK